jgi:hypothetical protein
MTSERTAVTAQQIGLSGSALTHYEMAFQSKKAGAPKATQPLRFWIEGPYLMANAGPDAYACERLDVLDRYFGCKVR